jgi:preprotein translocase subunit SecD
VVAVIVAVVLFILPNRDDGSSPGPTPSIAAGIEVRPVLTEKAFLPSTSTETASAQPAPTGIPDDLQAEFDAMTACTTVIKGISTEPVLGCDETTKFVLGPAQLSQSDLSSALALANDKATAWLIEVRLNEEGTKTLTDLTTMLAEQSGAQQQMAVILNGQILDVLPVTAPLTGGVFQLTQDYPQRPPLSIAAALSSPAESGVTP